MSDNPQIPVENLKPGEMMEVEVSGVKVLVANVDGRYRAINNVCTHRQCPLSAGLLEGDVITCACHGSRFDVTTGEVMNGPATRPEAVYGVSVENGVVSVDIGSEAA